MKLLVISAVLLVTLGVVLCDTDKNTVRKQFQTDPKWAAYKQRHLKNKSFKNDKHEEASFKNFLKTDEVIAAQNEKYEKGEADFKLEHNWISALSEDEKKSLYGTVAPPKESFKSKRDLLYQPRSNPYLLPTSFDWTTKGWNPVARNQQTCGSCWAFAACASMEAQYYIKTGKIANCAPQYMVGCSKTVSSQTFQTSGCAGGWYGDALRYVAVSGGNPVESTYPYINANSTCQYVPSTNRVFKVTDVYRVPQGSETALMDAIVNVGPVITCINADGINFSQYRTGIYKDLSTLYKQCNHAVTIVGYGPDHWKIRNSWGSTNWGESGYVRYARGANYGQILDYNVVPIAAPMF